MFIFKANYIQDCGKIMIIATQWINKATDALM